ncbi:MAG TPA: hypothetical protein VGG12_08990 [Methylovirgula sp.]|jgi:hypothetical protein
MIKLLAGCMWVCLVTAAAGYGAAVWKLNATEAMAAVPPAEKLQYHKTKTLNVPMIANGAVQGYVVVQLGFTQSSKAPAVAVPPEAFLLDEAFRIIYTDPKLDFRHLEHYDVGNLTRTLVTRVNSRLGADVIKEVLVEEINFVSNGDISR